MPQFEIGPDLIYLLIGIVVIGLVIALILLVWIFSTIKYIDVPKDADFFGTLRYTPLSVVILIDLLDLSLDFLSGPVAWIILDRLGLKQLRGIAAFEGLLPGTNLLPTMTLAWIAARFMKK